MAFDIKTAKPASTGFDISTAKPLEQAPSTPAYGGKEGFKRLALGGPSGFFSASGSEDVLPMAGQIAGGELGGFGGAVGGTAVGESAKNTIKAIRGQKFGASDYIADPSAGADLAMTTATEGAFRGIGKALKPAANRMMLSIMKPSREVIKRSPNLGTDALDLGIVGSKSGMADKAEKLVGQYENQIGDLLKGNNKRINAKIILDQLDSAKADAVKGLKPEDANAIETVKQNFTKQLPEKTTTTVEETPSFVMGPASRQVNPQITQTFSKDMTGALGQFQNTARYEPIRLKSGKFGRSEPMRQMLTPKTFIENPEDIVAMNNPGNAGAKPRKIVSISPKETYSIRPQTMGPISRTVKIATEPDMLGLNLEQGQAIKKAIYAETPDAAFNRSMQENPGATEARRLVASGIRKEIAGAEPKAAEILKNESTALKVKKALENRIANEQKNMVIQKLSGMGAGGAVVSGHPGAGIGILMGDILTGGIRSAPILSRTAQALNYLSKRPILGQLASGATAELGRRILGS